VDADQWLNNFARLIEQTPISSLPKLISEGSCPLCRQQAVPSSNGPRFQRSEQFPPNYLPGMRGLRRSFFARTPGRTMEFRRSALR
jgi:hypothetical protein